MVKFLHTADWQIGMKAAHVGTAGQRVRAERLDSAKRVVDIAHSHGAEFLIVSGDTFEDNAVDRVTVQKVADILGKFNGPVYLIPGNHDPLGPGSVWDHAAWNAHANLHLLDAATPFAIDGATLYPCPLFEKHSLQDPTQWIDASDDPNIAIGIGHGTVIGISQSELDYPIARDAANKANLDFLCLGHWHSYSTYPVDDGSVRMAYSGTHETTKFGERDSGNALLVEIADRGSPPILTSLRTGGLVWESIDATLTSPGDATPIREQIESIDKPNETLLRVRLDGILYHQDQAELERIDDLIQARFLYGRMDTANLLPNPTDESWLEQLPSGVMQAVAQRLQSLADPQANIERPDNASPAVATRALLELYRMVKEESE